MALRIIALEGDETGQELLEQALRVLAADVVGFGLDFPRFDLSLEHRRETENGVVFEAAAAVRDHGLGLKAATITPEGADDVGSPNKILREAVDGRVIIRAGRRIPGVNPIAGVHRLGVRGIDKRQRGCVRSGRALPARGAGREQEVVEVVASHYVTALELEPGNSVFLDNLNCATQKGGHCALTP